MNRHAVYTGCATGAAAVAALFYPLYVVLPKSYIADWGGGSESLGLILSIAAAILLVVGGGLSSHWGGARTRWQGVRLGALAGGIAGTMAFAALGAGAAGTIGLGESLLNGVRPLLEDPQSLLADAIAQIANYTYLALWGMWLGGALLGALGGLLTRPGAGEAPKEDESAVRIAEVISNRLLLVSLLIPVVSVTTTPILLGSEGVTISLFNWPVGSGFALYLAIMLWILRLAQDRLARNPALYWKRQVNAQLYVASGLSLLALGVMVITRLSASRTAQEFESRPIFNPVFLTGTLASLALSGYMLKRAIGLSRELRAANHETQTETARPKSEARSFLQKENIPLVAWISGTAFALPPLTLVPLVINLTRGVLPAFAMLADFETTRLAGGAAVGIVQDVFRSQALVAYGVFLIGAVSMLGSLSIASVIAKLRERAH